jgi:hypothetical protein
VETGRRGVGADQISGERQISFVVFPHEDMRANFLGMTAFVVKTKTAPLKLC